MNQPEVTLRPRGKLKRPTFTQILTRILSQNRDRQCQNTLHALQKPFPSKKGGQAKEQTHGRLLSVRQTREGKNGGKGKVAQI